MTHKVPLELDLLAISVSFMSEPAKPLSSLLDKSLCGIVMDIVMVDPLTSGVLDTSVVDWSKSVPLSAGCDELELLA